MKDTYYGICFRNMGILQQMPDAHAVSFLILPDSFYKSGFLYMISDNESRMG